MFNECIDGNEILLTHLLTCRYFEKLVYSLTLKTRTFQAQRGQNQDFGEVEVPTGTAPVLRRGAIFPLHSPGSVPVFCDN